MLGTYKAVGIGAAIAAVLGFQTYDSMSTRHALEDRIGGLERDIQSVRDADSAGVTRVASDLGVVSEKLGITERDLEQSRKIAEQLRQEHAKTAKGLKQELASTSKAVTELREVADTTSTKLDTTNTKITEVQTDATNKIGVVSGDVQNVKLDLDSTKNDLAASRKEMGDMRDSLGREIAKNSGEVAELRRRGERDYFEFDIQKGKGNTRIADIQLQLKKADMKARKYDLVVQANDSPLEKKGVPVNEPITFLVGKDHLRYELVVYSVDKDRIRGYVSTPKDKVLSAEGPRPDFRH